MSLYNDKCKSIQSFTISKTKNGKDMTALTTRQRDLLRVLLKSSAQIGAEDLAVKTRLTPRQASYGLKGVKSWLLQRNIELEVTPGVGIGLNCSVEEKEEILQDLASLTEMQLILSVGQRQQLLALILLVAESPMFLAELETLGQVSRSTTIKDLDIIAEWASQHGMTLVRRPNFGIELNGTENLRQELIAALLWGETPFGRPLTKITHTHGIVFSLHDDAALLPLVKQSDEVIQSWNMGRVFAQVAYAEAQLGGRFTDDAVLHLALSFAIQTDRVEKGHHLEVSPDNIEWMKSLEVWNVARMVAKRLGWRLSAEWGDIDTAGIAMHILAAPRNERWPGDLELDAAFSDVMGEVMEHIVNAYETPEMEQDRTLHDGIVNHVIPACLRQKFDLWHPSPPPATSLSEKYASEHEIANELAALIKKHTSVKLPDAEINNIAALLRAARIRIRPYRFHQVIIVCPSGMATAQLLVARLEARFPRLGPLKVVSLRELDAEQMSRAGLIITTVPLAEEISNKIDVVQVHPLLLPEDIESITEYLM
jgi:mannitol operon transcriptional antiterminator